MNIYQIYKQTLMNFYTKFPNSICASFQDIQSEILWIKFIFLLLNPMIINSIEFRIEILILETVDQ